MTNSQINEDVVEVMCHAYNERVGLGLAVCDGPAMRAALSAAESKGFLLRREEGGGGGAEDAGAEELDLLDHWAGLQQDTLGKLQDVRRRSALTDEGIARILSWPLDSYRARISGVVNTNLQHMHDIARAFGWRLRVVVEPLPTGSPDQPGIKPPNPGRG